MIEFRDVSYAYPTPDGRVEALSGVSLRVRRGERVALLGPNGSGKSTVARMANGLVLPDSGSVTVDGMDTSDVATATAVRASVGFVAQDPDGSIVATTVEDDVAFGPENLGIERAGIRARVDAALESVGLTGFEGREPHVLSGGQKQRLAIAGVLAMSPAYVVMDEPTSMLDTGGCAEVRATIDSLQRAGHGILHVTHDLTDAAFADRVMVLGEGTVVFEGTGAQLFEDPRLESWGLELPSVGRFVAALRDAGFELPAVGLDPDGVLKAVAACLS